MNAPGQLGLMLTAAWVVVAIATVHDAFGFFMNWTAHRRARALSITC